MDEEEEWMKKGVDEEEEWMKKGTVEGAGGLRWERCLIQQVDNK